MSERNNMGKYSSSPLWADITPIPLSDGPSSSSTSMSHSPQSAAPALATISYTPKYSEAMSYLRAVMARNEFSERCVALTEDVISMNPAHYTVWLYRAKVLRELEKLDNLDDGDGELDAGVEGRGRMANSKLAHVAPPSPVKRKTNRDKNSRTLTELTWLENVSLKHLKNYQIWHHRQLFMSQLSSLPDGETAFLARMLALDVKNYHVWTYRQWLCLHFPSLGSSAAELAFTDSLIHEDVRNNSAWSHRWFLVFGMDDITAKKQQQQQKFSKAGAGASSHEKATSALVDEDVIDREIAYAQSKIRLAPQNQSPWLYLRGVLRKAGRSITDVEKFAAEFVVVPSKDHRSDANAAEDSDGDGNGEGKFEVLSSHALDLLADCAVEKGEVARAKHYLGELGRKWDPVRRNYWVWRAGLLDDEEGEAEEGEEEQEEDGEGEGEGAEGGGESSAGSGGATEGGGEGGGEQVHYVLLPGPQQEQQQHRSVQVS